MTNVYELAVESAQFELMVESIEYTTEGVVDTLKSIGDRIGSFVLRYYDLQMKIITWFRTNAKWLTNKIIEDAIATAFEKTTEYGVKLHNFRYNNLFDKARNAIAACMDSAKSGKCEHAKLEAANLAISFKELNATYADVSIRKNTVLKDLDTRKKVIEDLQKAKAHDLVKAAEALVKKVSSDANASKEQVKYVSRIVAVAQRFAALVLAAMEAAKSDIIKIQNKIGAKAPKEA